MQRAQDWLREAEAELAATRDLLAGGHWSWCCFTAQQSAEKAIKALAEHFRALQADPRLAGLVPLWRGKVTVNQMDAAGSSGSTIESGSS